MEVWTLKITADRKNRARDSTAGCTKFANRGDEAKLKARTKHRANNASSSSTY